MVVLKDEPAYLAGFGCMALFWAGHLRWSRRCGLEDGPNLTLSLALVFVVPNFIYPLKLVFSAFFASITGGWSCGPPSTASPCC